MRHAAGVILTASAYVLQGDGMVMKRLVAAIGVAVLVGIFGVVASALGHSEYDYSTPNAGEVLTTAPTRLDAYFTEDLSITPGNNDLDVAGPGGGDVDNNDVTVDPGDRKHMSVTLQSGLVSGAYTVNWATTSFEDGDSESGTFTFTLELAEEPQPTAPAGGQTPVATSPVSGAPRTGTGPGTGNGDSSPFDALIVALALLGGAGVLAGAALAGVRRGA
jgi:methionine-rich copper-binding protein CopC